MRPMQKIFAIALVLLLAATVYGLVQTAQPVHAPGSRNPAGTSTAPAVDQTPILTAFQLAKMPRSEEEKPFAEQALEIADKDMDVAYAAAKRELEEHPAPLSAEAKQIRARLNQAEDALAADEERVERLTAEEAKANGARKDDLHNQLVLAQANQQDHQDEVDDAKEDLARAGGDSSSRIEALTQEHEASSKVIDNLKDSLKAAGGAAVEQTGLIQRFSGWWALHQKQLLLWQARQQAESAAAAFAASHKALEAQSEAAPGIKAASSAAPVADGPATANAGEPAKPGQEGSADVVQPVRQRASLKKTLSTLDQRIDNQKQLADNYSNWIVVVAARQRAVLRGMLVILTIILSIALFGIYFATLMDKVVGRLNMDRRQIQSLHTVAHVTVRLVAFLLILLVIIGPPGQLGTFLGLAGAGLTVALKDFIVGFMGWFVLMGKNGIRLGDWVEINGVTGEVVEIGPFHTVLLETGNWTDSGHPTGRRVTFTNSFAIEGHYFNFSTSGQWLWDELQLVLPAGQDPYPVVREIQKKVSEATKEGAKQAELEWRRATRSREMSSFSVDPAISVKPVAGGVEVAVRYITRANERYRLRAQLYQFAVEMLGGKRVPASAD